MAKVLFFGSCLIPFLFSGSIIDPVLLPRFMALSVLMIILISMISVQKRDVENGLDFSIVHNPVFLVCLCYLLVSAISLTRATNFTEGLFEWLRTFLAQAFFLIATVTINGHKNSLVLLSQSMIVTGMMLSIIGICQYYQVAFTFIPGNYVICSTMAHKNLFASSVFLTSPFAMYGILRFPGCWKVVSLSAFALIIFGIAISKTRTVWGAASLSGIMVLLFHFRRQFLWITAFCIISTAMLFYFTYSHFPLPTSHFPISRASLDERILLWKKSLDMIKENPVWGVGLGQWKIVLPRYGRIERWRESDNGLGEVWFQRPHNDYLWILSETGILGFFCHISFFLILITYMLRIVLKSGDTDEACFSTFMLFGILGYMVIAFFSFPKERMVHNVFLMLMAASVVSVYGKWQERSGNHNVEQICNLFPRHLKNCATWNIQCGKWGIWFVRGMLMIPLFCCAVFGYARSEAETHVRKAMAAQEAERWELVISEIDQANSWFYNMDSYSTPLFWHRGIANISLGNTTEALEDFKRAYEIHPYHIHVLNNIGTCHALSGNYEKATAFYHKALDISPNFQETLNNLSRIERN